MRRLFERSRQPAKKFPDGEDIPATCTLTLVRSTSEQDDCTEAKARSLRCRFLLCPVMTSPILSPTSPDTLPRDRSTLIEDYTEKESTHRSTLRPLSRD